LLHFIPGRKSFAQKYPQIPILQSNGLSKSLIKKKLQQGTHSRQIIFFVLQKFSAKKYSKVYYFRNIKRFAPI
jgi:hypothetical protein